MDEQTLRAEMVQKRRTTVLFYGLMAVAAVAMIIAMYLSR